MIVFVAGMPRSGSTFTFNIVRGLLEARGKLHQSPVGSVLAALEHAGSADHLILKGHAADEITPKLVKLGAVKAVCSVRKPEDAIASWMATFGFNLEDSIMALERWILLYQDLRHHALTLTFESIDQDPFAAARQIARYVCPDSSPEEADAVCRHYTKDRVQELAERVANREGAIEDIGFSYYDKATYFHRRHVTSLEETPAEARITADQIVTIRKALAPYCDEQGNLK